jgi:hypothetical protein
MHGNSSGLVAAAISEAILQAEQLQTEIARRLGPRSTALRLRAEAAKASALPVAAEQLLALALEAKAALAEGTVSSAALMTLARPPDPIRQLELRREIFRTSNGGVAGQEMSPFVFVAEIRRVGRTGSDPTRLAGWLRAASALNRELWDHPALPVHLRTREAMLACVPALAARAEAYLRSRSDGAFSPCLASPTPRPVRQP